MVWLFHKTKFSWFHISNHEPDAGEVGSRVERHGGCACVVFVVFFSKIFETRRVLLKKKINERTSFSFKEPYEFYSKLSRNNNFLGFDNHPDEINPKKFQISDLWIRTEICAPSSGGGDFGEV